MRQKQSSRDYLGVHFKYLETLNIPKIFTSVQ